MGTWVIQRMALCDLCGEVFSNHFQLGPHKRVCRQVEGVLSEDDLFSEDDAVDDAHLRDVAHPLYAVDDADLRDDEHPLWELARRERNWGAVYPCFVEQNVICDNSRTHDYCAMQKVWRDYVRNVYNLCSPAFWRIFELVKEATGAKASKTLRQVKLLLHAQPQINVRLGHSWPTSIPILKTRIITRLGNFWDNVTRDKVIDLSAFKCGTVKQIKFSFLDPVYVWIRQCEKLEESGQKLVFEPRIMKNPDTGEEIYGADIEYGLLFRAATASVPRHGKVALINLSWDGGDTGYKSRSVCPICVQVMNTNSGSKFGVGLVGYLPRIEVSNALRQTKEYAQASHHLLQTCIGEVLRCIERRAEHGFKCVLGGHEHVFFPRLGAMTLDTVERVKYFGLRSVRSCADCRLRKGRSCARRAGRHDVDVLNNLFRWAHSTGTTAVTISQRSKARKKLQRHGFKHQTPCALHQYTHFCLVHVPQFPKKMFGALCTYERMHSFYIAFCTYAMDQLTACVQPSHLGRVEQIVKECQNFRDPLTGNTHPRLKSILAMTHLTAERRVRAMFYWAHILGTKAECIIPDLRTPALVVVATLQLMLIALRGHRSYSEQELNTIFGDVGTEFFKAVETLAAYFESKRLQRAAARHTANPRHFRKPLPFKRLLRFLEHTFTFINTHLPFITHICYLKHTSTF